MEGIVDQRWFLEFSHSITWLKLVFLHLEWNQLPFSVIFSELFKCWVSGTGRADFQLIQSRSDGTTESQENSWLNWHSWLALTRGYLKKWVIQPKHGRVEEQESCHSERNGLQAPIWWRIIMMKNTAEILKEKSWLSEGKLNATLDLEAIRGHGNLQSESNCGCLR